MGARSSAVVAKVNTLRRIAILIRLQVRPAPHRFGCVSKKIVFEVPPTAPCRLPPHTPRSTTPTSPLTSRTTPQNLSSKYSNSREELRWPLCIFWTQIGRLQELVEPHLHDKWRPYVRAPLYQTSLCLHPLFGSFTAQRERERATPSTQIYFGISICHGASNAVFSATAHPLPPLLASDGAPP